jgi:hypothetical protein
MLRTSSPKVPFSRQRFLTALAGLSLLGLGTTSLASGRAALRPQQREQMKQQVSEYSKCRKKVLHDYKGGHSNVDQAQQALASCRSDFTGASLYAECKTKLLTNRRNYEPNALKKALTNCQDYLIAGNFNPNDPFPFQFSAEHKVSFAGVELNLPVPRAELDPTNFTCAPVQEAFENPANARYMFFGNHPRLFGDLVDISRKSDLYALFKIKGLPTPRTDVPQFGRIEGDPARKEALVYFPTGQCDFERSVGQVFQGLQLHYLIDSEQQLAIPYVAVAYYQPSLEWITAAEIEKKIRAAMGDQTQLTLKKGDATRFLSATPITEFDGEGDPIHLCKKPRKHDFLAIVRASKGFGSPPDYLLLANIKNLCEYGDRLAQRLVKP